MGNYNFSKDFDNERKSMVVIADQLMKRFPNIVSVRPFEGQKEEADIVIEFPNGVTKAIEIKEDFYCAHSGNVAIEVFSRNKPSGLSVTKADIWLLIVHTKHNQKTEDCEFFFIYPKTLLSFIAKRAYERKHVGGDPGSNTEFYLFNFKKLKLLKEKESST